MQLLPLCRLLFLFTILCIKCFTSEQRTADKGPDEKENFSGLEVAPQLLYKETETKVELSEGKFPAL